jgi:lipopolysaccharide/colanic/teichoic acid biosynthesis glycosyltransferase
MEPKREVGINGASAELLCGAQSAGGRSGGRCLHRLLRSADRPTGVLLGGIRMVVKVAEFMQVSGRRAHEAPPRLARLGSFGSYRSGQDTVTGERRSRDIVAARGKRAFDFSVALVFLLSLAPALLLIAAFIKGTSRGPALFRQKRYGINGELFEIWKFRTMYMALGDQQGVKQTRDNDPRVTPFGRFLRRTSLDELPQMVNVLNGDMSLIGPRPHVPGMLAGGVLYEELVPTYHQRHVIRPGITGLAQVSGFRGSTEDAEHAKARVDYDLLYIETWSFILDLRILFLTGWRELTGGTGY